MFPVSSIGNDISSDLVRRKMNDLPESPIVNNLEALARYRKTKTDLYSNGHFT